MLDPALPVIAEMRLIAMVAGQCSVEGPEDAKSLMAAAEAERASRWADAVEAHLRAVEAAHQQEKEQLKAALQDEHDVVELQREAVRAAGVQRDQWKARAEAAEARRPALDAAPPRVEG